MRTVWPRPSWIPVGLVALATLVAGGCGNDASPSVQAHVTAVATTTQVADFVRQVGGDRVDVRQILQPNSDPHGYEPRPSDAAAVAEADVVFRSGGDVDEWLGGLIENAGGDATESTLIDAVHTRADGSGNLDPHWWQDPRNAITAVAAIERTLTRADPGGRQRYLANARAYTRRLRRLDRSVAACIAAVPAAQRRLVTSHDALGYYASRYGIAVVGALIPSLSTAAQPSARETEQLVDQVGRERVKAIFPESSISPKLEQAVARETGAKTGRPLWADTLGPKGSNGGSYVESIQSNTAALVEGLTGGARRCRPRG